MKYYFGLHNLVAPINASKNRKRLGRGESSGHGKTSGRGHKGQKARKSGNVRMGFEGGQNPLSRRVPKRGFTNFNFRKTYHLINISKLEKYFDVGEMIDRAKLVAAGLVPNMKCLIKLLGDGIITRSLVVRCDSASASAIKKIKEAGGSVELITKIIDIQG